MTRSPGWMSICRWVEKAIRVKADMLSPWLPVVMMHTCFLGRVLICSRGTTVPSGTFI